MGWSQFVYDHIEKELLKLKYPPAIAKGGLHSVRITTSDHHKPAPKGRYMTTAYGWQRSGPRRIQRYLTGLTKCELSIVKLGRLSNQHCSKENAPTARTVRASVIRYASQLQR